MPSVRGIWENVIAGLIVLVILAAATWAISRIDAPIALWGVVLIGFALFAAGLKLGRLMRSGEELLGYQADLIGEALLGLRDVIAGHINVSFEDFIERGVLGPARYSLSVVRNEEIRLSVLELDKSTQTFRMLYEAGHSLGQKNSFSLPSVSFAGHALQSGNLQWTNDVENDRRWQEHPLGNDSGDYRSLASMPIVVGEDAVAVLNVASNQRGAFLTGDLTYIELLGGFLGLAWALNAAAEASRTLVLSQEPTAPERKET